MTVSTPNPPHDLQLVIDFVNTHDLDRDTDELSTPAALADWLSDRELMATPASAVGAEGLRQTIALREALRRTMLAHNGREIDAAAAAELERAAQRGQLSVRFEADGSTRLEARRGNLDGALARILVPVAEAASDGTWERVKACRANDCLWAFYDQSRNRSARWCDMAVCGNRTKVRTYRTKQTPHTHHARGS